MKKTEWLIIAAIVAALAVLAIPISCNKTSHTTQNPPNVPATVKIVAVQEIDSMMRWGASGCTTIEYSNGRRRQIGGIYGKVGDTFVIQTEPVWIQ